MRGADGGGPVPHAAALALVALRGHACRAMAAASAAVADHRGALEASRCWARVGHAWEGAGTIELQPGPPPTVALHAPALQHARAAFAASLACVEGMGGLIAVARVLLGQEFEAQLATIMEAHTGRARTSWALFTAAAAEAAAEAGGARAAAAAAAAAVPVTDPEALAALRDACALLPQLPGHHAQSLIRSCSGHAQWHIFRGEWPGAAVWLELAVALSGGGGAGALLLPAAQANQLLLTQAFVSLQLRLQGAGGGGGAQDLSRIVSTVHLCGASPGGGGGGRQDSPLALHILARVAVLQGDLAEARRCVEQLLGVASDAEFHLVLTAVRALCSARRWEAATVGLYSVAARRFAAPACINELRADLISHLLADGAVDPGLLQLPPADADALPESASPAAAAHAMAVGLPIEDRRVSAIIGRMVAEHASGSLPLSGDAFVTVATLLADNTDGAFAAGKHRLALQLCELQLALLSGGGAGGAGSGEQQQQQQRGKLHRLMALCLLHLHDAAASVGAGARAGGPPQQLAVALEHARAAQALLPSDVTCLLLLRVMARMPLHDEPSAAAPAAIEPGSITASELSGALRALCSCPGFSPLLLALAVEELLGGVALPADIVTASPGQQLQPPPSLGQAGGSLSSPHHLRSCLGRLRVACDALRALLSAPEAALAAQPVLKYGVLARTLVTTQGRMADVTRALRRQQQQQQQPAEVADCNSGDDGTLSRAIETLAVLQRGMDHASAVLAAASSAAGLGSGSGSGATDAAPAAGLREVAVRFGGAIEAEWALRAGWNACLEALATDDALSALAGFALVDGYAQLVARMRRAEEAAAAAAAAAGGGGAATDAARLRLLAALRRNRAATGLSRLCSVFLAVTHMRLADAKAGLTPASHGLVSDSAAAAFPRLAALPPAAHIAEAQRLVAAARRATSSLTAQDSNVAATAGAIAGAGAGAASHVPEPDELVRTMDAVTTAVVQQLLASQQGGVPPQPVAPPEGAPAASVHTATGLLPLLVVVELHAKVRSVCLDATDAAPPASGSSSGGGGGAARLPPPLVAPDAARMAALRADVDELRSRGLSAGQLEHVAELLRAPPLASASLASLALSHALEMRLGTKQASPPSGAGAAAADTVDYPACASLLRRLLSLAESRHEMLPILERVRSAVHASLAASATATSRASLAPAHASAGGHSDESSAMLGGGDDAMGLLLRSDDSHGAGRPHKRSRVEEGGPTLESSPASSASAAAMPFPWEELDWAIGASRAAAGRWQRGVPLGKGGTRKAAQHRMRATQLHPRPSTRPAVTAFNAGVYFYRSRSLEAAARFMGWAVSMLPAMDALLAAGRSPSHPADASSPLPSATAAAVAVCLLYREPMRRQLEHVLSLAAVPTAASDGSAGASPLTSPALQLRSAVAAGLGSRLELAPLPAMTSTVAPLAATTSTTAAAAVTQPPRPPTAALPAGATVGGGGVGARSTSCAPGLSSSSAAAAAAPAAPPVDAATRLLAPPAPVGVVAARAQGGGGDDRDDGESGVTPTKPASAVCGDSALAPGADATAASAQLATAAATAGAAQQVAQRVAAQQVPVATVAKAPAPAATGTGVDGSHVHAHSSAVQLDSRAFDFDLDSDVAAPAGGGKAGHALAAERGGHAASGEGAAAAATAAAASSWLDLDLDDLQLELGADDDMGGAAVAAGGGGVAKLTALAGITALLQEEPAAMDTDMSGGGGGGEDNATLAAL